MEYQFVHILQTPRLTQALNCTLHPEFLILGSGNTNHSLRPNGQYFEVKGHCSWYLVGPGLLSASWRGPWILISWLRLQTGLGFRVQGSGAMRLQLQDLEFAYLRLNVQAPAPIPHPETQQPETLLHPKPRVLNAALPNPIPKHPQPESLRCMWHTQTFNFRA